MVKAKERPKIQKKIKCGIIPDIAWFYYQERICWRVEMRRGASIFSGTSVYGGNL
jgi:hypothetical protein